MEEANGETFTVITTADFSKICRCCLSSGCLFNMFEHSFKDKTFVYLYKTFCGIEVKPDDNLPQSSCENCMTKLMCMFEFKDKCARSEKLLEDLPANGKIHINGENNVNEITASCAPTDEIDIKEESCHSEENSSTFADNIDISENSHAEEIDNSKLKADDLESQSYTSEKIVYPELEGAKDISDQKAGVPKTSRMQNLTCCQETFTTYLSYIRHYKKMNHKRSDRNHKCPHCEKFFRRCKLKQHMLSHTKEKPFACKFCFMQFSLAGNLKRHINIHTGERPHCCDICGKGFIQAGTLAYHKRTHTGEKPFACSECDKKFIQRSALRAHLQIHQLKSEGFLQSNQCETCKKVFDSKQLLKRHMHLHGEKSFLCSQCGKGFTTNAALKTHFNIHIGVKPYACEFCSKRFSQGGALKTHILVHTGEKPFICEVCSKSFNQRGHLRTHLMLHRGEKPYSCSLCTKSFSEPAALRIHIRTHTGETPYVCNVCSKGFKSPSNFKKHKKKHDTATNNQIVK